MQVALRWVYQVVTDRRGVPVESGQRPTLCFRGRKWMLGIAVGYPVRVIKRPVKDFDVLRSVVNQRTKEDYSVELAVDKLKEIAQRNGITIGASKLLDRAMREAASLDDEDEFENEEEETKVETVRQETDEAEFENEEEETKVETVRQETDEAETSGEVAEETTAEPGSETADGESSEEATTTGDDATVATKKKATKKAKSKRQPPLPKVTKVNKNPRVEADKKPAKKAAKTAASPKAAQAAAKAAPRAAGAKKAPNRDFEKEVLPVIVKEFKKLDDADNRPRGFAQQVFAVLMDKFSVTKNTADQYYWKAIWAFPKALGIKKAKKK